jgi:hypothetical protein
MKQTASNTHISAQNSNSNFLMSNSTNPTLCAPINSGANGSYSPSLNQNRCFIKDSTKEETFKLVEKIQPKKSRTKYTKEQIEVLENAFWRNPYPDLITVEQLCKNLSICKEKINVILFLDFLFN